MMLNETTEILPTPWKEARRWRCWFFLYIIFEFITSSEKDDVDSNEIDFMIV